MIANESVLPHIREVRRVASPAKAPQGLCHDGKDLWVSSRDTFQVYGISIEPWAVFEEKPATNTPWGMTAADDVLYATIGEPPDDDRFIRKYVKGIGFSAKAVKRCPGGTGSYLAHDGAHLILIQFYARRALYLDDSLDVARVAGAQHDICGAVYAMGALWLVTTDDEETDDYWLSRIRDDDGQSNASSEDIARIPFKARSLAWDGSRFWTNHRERDEIVAFDAPG